MLAIPNSLGSGMGKVGGVTMQEKERAEVISACAKGDITVAVAAERLDITTRHVRRLVERFSENGFGGLASKRWGRPSNNQLAPDLAKKALQLVHERYADFGPTLACEQLRVRHQLELSKETLRHLMIEASLWIPKAARSARLHQPRERRPCVGELVQIDGSRHRWFEGRSAACTLLVFVDDATGKILQLHFAETETTASYFEATRRYIARHGKPQAFYADRAAVFCSAMATRRTRTQYQRALDELNIELICANSPQAKGRVERLNRTLQDRLVKEMRLEGISDIASANAWCATFINRFNEGFARIARSPLDVHVPPHRSDNLSLILAFHETRKLSPKLTLQFDGLLYLLQDKPEVRALIGQRIDIHTDLEGRTELRANGWVLAHTCLELPKPVKPIKVDGKTLHHAVDKKVRNRNERKNLPQDIIATGVTAARKMSAQSRL